MSVGVEIRPDGVYTEEVEVCTCVDNVSTDTTTDTTTDTSSTDDSSTDTTTDTSSTDTTTDTSSTDTTTDDSSTDTTTTDSTGSTRRRRLDETASTEDQTCTCEMTNVDLPRDPEAEIPYAGYHHATKQIQEIGYNHTYALEEWDILITNPSGGWYTLNLLSPPGAAQLSVHTTGVIQDNGSAWKISTALNSFYRSNFGCYTRVTKTMFDADGAETSSSSAAVTIRYRVSPTKLIEGVSSTMIAAIPTTYYSRQKSTARFAVSLPSEVQQSTPPFAGYYTVTCADQYGFNHTSKPISVGQTGASVKNSLQSIPFLVDNFDYEDNYDATYYFPHNHINFRLHFTGIDFQMEPCVIASYEGEEFYPLTGNFDMEP